MRSSGMPVSRASSECRSSYHLIQLIITLKIRPAYCIFQRQKFYNGWNTFDDLHRCRIHAGLFAFSGVPREDEVISIHFFHNVLIHAPGFPFQRLDNLGFAFMVHLI